MRIFSSVLLRGLSVSTTGRLASGPGSSTETHGYPFPIVSSSLSAWFLIDNQWACLAALCSKIKMLVKINANRTADAE